MRSQLGLMDYSDLNPDAGPSKVSNFDKLLPSSFSFFIHKMGHIKIYEVTL